MITRRIFMGAAASAALSGCTTVGTGGKTTVPAAPKPTMPAFYGPVPDEPYPIPAVPAGVVPERCWRATVDNP